MDPYPSDSIVHLHKINGKWVASNRCGVVLHEHLWVLKQLVDIQEWLEAIFIRCISPLFVRWLYCRKGVFVK